MNAEWRLNHSRIATKLMHNERVIIENERIMIAELQDEETVEDMVEAFLAAHLPKGSEHLVPVLRPLLLPLARKMRADAARAVASGSAPASNISSSICRPVSTTSDMTVTGPA